MPELHQTSDGFIELKDDGTFLKHKVKIIHQGDHILRIDTDDAGVETPSFITPKTILVVDSVTGDISHEQRGFVVDHEIIGVPIHPDTDKDYVRLDTSDIPDDLIVKDPVTKKSSMKYKWDKVTKLFEVKP